MAARGAYLISDGKVRLAAAHLPTSERFRSEPTYPANVPRKTCRPRLAKPLVQLPLLVVFLVLGCAQVRKGPTETPPPGQAVTHYLKGMFNPGTQREAYDLLTAEAKKAIPYPNFVTLRDAEVLLLVGKPAASDTRVFVSLFDQHDFSADHSVIYALLTVRHPYSTGEKEAYALVRLHCRKEAERWAIEPFMHAKTGTLILIPTRKRGPLWKISDDMEQITALVRDEIPGYQKEKAPPAEEPPTPEPEEAEKPLAVPPEPVKTEPVAPSPPAIPPPSFRVADEKKVEALLSIGKLCYEAGKVDAAEDTFRRVLFLDPNNSIAKDYLSRCENYRLLQKEKEEAVRLMEELLRLESGEHPPK